MIAALAFMAWLFFLATTGVLFIAGWNRPLSLVRLAMLLVVIAMGFAGGFIL